MIFNPKPNFHPIPEGSNGNNKPEQVITPEVLEKQQQLIGCLSNGDIDSAKELLEAFPLSPELVTTAVQQRLVKHLSEEYGGYIDRAKKLLEAFPLSPEFLASSEVTTAVQQRLVNHLSKGYIRGDIDTAKKLLEAFPLSPELVTTAVQQELVNDLSERYIYSAQKLLEAFPLSPEFLASSEVTTAVQQGLVKHLSEGYGGYIDRAKELLEAFPLSPELVTTAVQQGLVNDLSEGDIDRAKELLEAFPLSPELVTTAVQQGLVKRLSKGYIYSAQKLLEAFPLSSEIFTKEFITKYIPDFSGFLEQLAQVVPQLFIKYEHNGLQLLNLYTKRNILHEIEKLSKEYPWIVDTLEDNPRFADKLIFKFSELDELSQQHIDFLYTQKENIFKRFPDIDPNSTEYRNQVQQELLGYENNQSIIESIQESGVHVESWLSYDREQSFMLGKAEQVSFAEMVQTPVERISETLGIYKTSFRNVFGEYQKELQAFRIPLESIEDIQNEIKILQGRIHESRQQGQEAKAQGMQKGLDILHKRLENPKTAPLWQKITGDFDAIVRVGSDVGAAHKKLIDTEKYYNQIIQQEHSLKEERQKVFEQKKLIHILLQEFKEKLNLLELRMKEFTGSVQEMIEPCLGSDRTIALVQELNDYTFEALDHFTSDIKSSQSSLEQKLNSDEGSKNKLEGRFLKIGVWGRNPDRDLYLGNYTDCCIRIDSDHMGSESTIADYLTDVGVQVVTVVDEITNEPIVAAWTYIGNKSGKPKMVIDNIEANRSYAQYFSTIKDQLHEYFKEYAKAVHIPETDISQGQNNNDITLSVEVGDFYNKMGGYNRINGYYLEAEPDEDEDDYEDYEDDDYEDEDDYEDYNEEDDGLGEYSEDSLYWTLNDENFEKLEQFREKLNQ